MIENGMNKTNEIYIDAEFHALIPALTPEEYKTLEENIIRDDCRDPLVVWDNTDLICEECGDGTGIRHDNWDPDGNRMACTYCGFGIKRDLTLIDGHNRLEICEKNNMDYAVDYMEFPDRDAVKAWIIRNQFGRRNLTPYQRAELALKLEPLVAAKAKERQGERTDIVQNSAPSEEFGKTRDKVARAAGVSHDTIHKVKTIQKKAPEEVKQKLRAGEMSINKAYSDIRTQEKREENTATLEDISVQEAKAIEGVYDVVVIDPPWPMKKIERECRPNQTGLDYPSMTEDELNNLEIPYAENCHVWLWATHKQLPTAIRLLEKWGLKYVCAFVWHKPGGFQPVGLPQYNCEFVLYARKGAPKFVDTKAFPVCFEAPRGKHSEKPERLYEMVRRVTGGRRLDMFNRREIEGFDGWGKEA